MTISLLKEKITGKTIGVTLGVLAVGLHAQHDWSEGKQPQGVPAALQLTAMSTGTGSIASAGAYDLPPLKWSSLKYVLTVEDRINGEEEAYG